MRSGRGGREGGTSEEPVSATKIAFTSSQLRLLRRRSQKAVLFVLLEFVENRFQLPFFFLSSGSEDTLACGGCCSRLLLLLVPVATAAAAAVAAAAAALLTFFLFRFMFSGR